ncbi:hypothetical protein [Marinilabilia sp.]|uniref:hypothetical protein n=1 Tax=Marinilabilia sp. TaxID=2021252 RepID=UPI0025C25BFC|nr:hypothetical protein [Marinilabilia sp.]
MKYPLFILLFYSLFVACSVETSVEINDPSGEDESPISQKSLEGAINGEDFILESALVSELVMFEDNGFKFFLFSSEETCSDDMQYIGSDVSFFVESEIPLAPGEYEGKGPYFSYKTESGSASVSFLGCTLIIDDIDGDLVSGRVRGGDVEDGTYIEGAFEATLCGN